MEPLVPPQKPRGSSSKLGGKPVGALVSPHTKRVELPQMSGGNARGSGFPQTTRVCLPPKYSICCGAHGYPAWKPRGSSVPSWFGGKLWAQPLFGCAFSPFGVCLRALPPVPVCVWSSHALSFGPAGARALRARSAWRGRIIRVSHEYQRVCRSSVRRKDNLLKQPSA